MSKFSPISSKRLAECHPDLQTVMFTAIIDTPSDFGIACGHRSVEEQERLFAERKSKVHGGKSKHNATPSLAVDIVPYVDGLDVYTWGRAGHLRELDPKLITARTQQAFFQCKEHIFAVAERLGVELRWGGDWDRDNDSADEKFIDMPHFELV